MKLTSNNFWSEDTPVFYKATTGGIQQCIILDNMHSGDGAEDYYFGYIVDSLFVRLRVNVPGDVYHFDHPNQGFFAEESEAIAYHRELVLNYINGLNNSTLKSCPIVIG